MMIASHIETAFEQVIEDYLLSYGYVKTLTSFDKTRAIFPKMAIACTVAEPKSIVSACVPRPLPRICKVLLAGSKSRTFN